MHPYACWALVEYLHHFTTKLLMHIEEQLLLIVKGHASCQIAVLYNILLHADC